MRETKKQNGKVRIKDIAEHCSVSTTSVSLVLHGRPGVSEQTRLRVEESISELGYKPIQNPRVSGNGHSRARKTRRLSFLVIRTSELKKHAFYGPIMFGLISRAQELGAQIKAISISPDMKNPPEINPNQVGGVVFLGNPHMEVAKRALAASVPFVQAACSRGRFQGTVFE